MGRRRRPHVPRTRTGTLIGTSASSRVRYCSTRRAHSCGSFGARSITTSAKEWRPNPLCWCALRRTNCNAHRRLGKTASHHGIGFADAALAPTCAHRRAVAVRSNSVELTRRNFKCLHHVHRCWRAYCFGAGNALRVRCGCNSSGPVDRFRQKQNAAVSSSWR